MDELLDLVNEKDEVIGEVWRSEATGNKNKIIREVAVLIFDKNNKILLQQRSFNKKSYPGYWIISASGHVDKGELPDVAAKKEVSEELGINIILKLLDKKLMRYPNDSAFAYRYVGEFNENNFVIVNIGEGTGVRLGEQLSVYRDSKYIAKLEVIQVRKDISAADIKEQSSKIKVGDSVR